MVLKGMSHTNSNWAVYLSAVLCIYSLFIFKDIAQMQITL